MYKDGILDETMLSMADEAARCIDPELFEKGRSFYHRKLVRWTKPYGSRIYSAVNDAEMHTVIIRTDDFSNSTCSCAKKHCCEHIAAVFFHYYEPWQSANRSSSKIKTPAGGKTSPPKSRSSVKNTLPVPVMEGPVERWYEYFERQYTRIKKEKKKDLHSYWEYAGEPYFLLSLFDNFTGAVTVPSDNWPPFNKTLYRFHMILFFMAGLEKQVKGADLSFLNSYLVRNIEDGFLAAFVSIRSDKQREKYDLFLQKAVAVARECLFEGCTALFDWLFFYRTMCVNLFNNPENETAYLEQFSREPEKNQPGYYYAALGLASLKMAARKNEEALALLHKLKEKRIDDMLFYLRYFSQAKDWDNLLIWLRWLTPEIMAANPAVLKNICEFCLYAAKNDSAGEEFIQLVSSWLPRSLDFYANYLIEAGLIREWAELTMTYRGYTWENINKNVLRQLESRDPAALIPLYHQWAARLIEEKNRKSYQEAVKVLKKLHTLYNKQKIPKEWHAFILRLTARYPRLRALQEELRKGKLIS